MNNRYIKMMALVASSVIFVSGCGDNSTFETPSAAGTFSNDGIISQKNFILLFSPLAPKFYDVVNNTFTEVTSEISVRIGDNDNRLITGNRTIFFRSEWGLIDPSCTTVDGTCSVTWTSGEPFNMPADLKANILVFSSNGQESFTDINGNGLFDDGDSFEDLEEPYVDVDKNSNFTPGDLIEDTINGLDLTGQDLQHNAADGLYNGPNCSHSTLCSTVLTTATVWSSGSLTLTGSDKFSIGGTVSGLIGTVVLQNNGDNDLAVTADGSFVFATKLSPGLTYTVTVSSQPAGQTCTVSNASGTVLDANIISVTVTCI
jgi:hypothetical protein